MDKENKKEKGLSKNFLIILICTFFILVILVVIGFIVFFNQDKEIIEETKNGGNVTLNYSANSSGLSIVNAVPTTNAIGMINADESQYFDFSVDVDLDEADSVNYEIFIKKNSNNTISDDDIRIYLEQEKSGTYVKVSDPVSFKAIKEDSKLGTKKGNMILTKCKKTNSGTDNYRLRMWLADSSLTPVGNYSVELNIVGKAK